MEGEEPRGAGPETDLGPEVEGRVEAFFPDEADRRRVREALATYGRESWETGLDRVRLAILKLCDGEVAKVVSLAELAKRDFRDVVMWAEYPGEGQALWSLRPDLAPTEQARLQEIRQGDRRQYLDWLERTGRRR